MPALWQSLSFPGAVHCAESRREVERINTTISKDKYKLQNHLRIQLSHLPATTSGAVNAQTLCHVQTLATVLETYFSEMFFGKRPQLLEQCFKRITYAILLMMESGVINNDQSFRNFEHIFARLIQMNNKYSEIIGTKKNWEYPATLFGTTKITANQEFSNTNCMFDEYAIYVGETP